SAVVARRERAAQLVQELELPTFKGRPGWEFTDISALDLADYVPAGAPPNGDGVALPEPLLSPDAVAELRQVDGGKPVLTGEPPEGVTVMSLERAAAELPELVARHLGTVVDADDVFVARNDAGLRGGAFVHIGAGVALTRPILLSALQSQSGSELARRTVIVLEPGSQAEVW